PLQRCRGPLRHPTSIVDILGHTPDEVKTPFARDFHRRGVKLDKAAVLAYCRIKNRDGNYVGCECCFSVCYDVMVCCTSIYRRGMTSQKRAVEAPIVRKLFSSSVKDPRYHMLSHLSAKFDLGHSDQTHEPRAALGIEQVIGISNDQMKGKSFYYCIQENCLEDAVRVLETAKGNDSIAYMRFWFRDPRVQDPHREPSESEAGETEDEEMTDVTEDEDDSSERSTPTRNLSGASGTDTDVQVSSTEAQTSSHGAAQSSGAQHSSDESNFPPTDRHAALLGIPRPRSSVSSRATPSSSSAEYPDIELEAVVSCTSDVSLSACAKLAPSCPRLPILNRRLSTMASSPLLGLPVPVFLPPLPVPVRQRCSSRNLGASAAEHLRCPQQLPSSLGLSPTTRVASQWASPSHQTVFPSGSPRARTRPSSLPRKQQQRRTSASGIKDPFGDPGLGSRRFGLIFYRQKLNCRCHSSPPRTRNQKINSPFQRAAKYLISKCCL
ncbi:uncharacterized protein IWZ02DRAFT_466042, partial [Phyllosticta citriasiana]|uniref:uncharacterized protein n=1 Tax=Phyllosticta citriasiana TaxID=595635 RepID=UPI0030FDAD10